MITHFERAGNCSFFAPFHSSNTPEYEPCLLHTSINDPQIVGYGDLDVPRDKAYI